MATPRDYLFLHQTTSLCESCLKLVPTKVIQREQAIYFRKQCAEHGTQERLISDDADYYRLCQQYIKPGDQQLVTQTATDKGCPFDCGLCPDHEQHSCLGIIEIIDECNLSCPVCFANSAPGRGGARSLSEVEAMLNTLVASEGEPDLVQISGGEPTLHPQLLDIIRLVRSKPIRHTMLNTNGLRIAQDRAFVRDLAEFRTGFEVSLQFDSLQAAALHNIRGADLRSIHHKALEHLEAEGISTTLVCVLKRGVNDDELGEIIRYALGWRCVRGVTFQMVQDCGRNDNYQASERMTLSQARGAIISQSEYFSADDLIPLPCNPQSICIGYGLRQAEGLLALTSLIPREELLRTLPNSISFERFPQLRQRINELLSLSCIGEAGEQKLHALLCCLPQIAAPAQLGYDAVFRVVIIEFMDRFNFCLGGVKRSCIHFVTDDGRIIPFDTRNLFHRANN